MTVAPSPAEITRRLEEILYAASTEALETISDLGFQPSEGFDILAASSSLIGDGRPLSDAEKARLKAALDLAIAAARLGAALKWFEEMGDVAGIGAAQVAVEAFVLGRNAANLSDKYVAELTNLRPSAEEQSVALKFREGRSKSLTARISKKEAWQQHLTSHYDSLPAADEMLPGQIVDSFKLAHPKVLPTSDGPTRFIKKLQHERRKIQ